MSLLRWDKPPLCHTKCPTCPQKEALSNAQDSGRRPREKSHIHQGHTIPLNFVTRAPTTILGIAGSGASARSLMKSMGPPWIKFQWGRSRRYNSWSSVPMDPASWLGGASKLQTVLLCPFKQKHRFWCQKFHFQKKTRFKNNSDSKHQACIEELLGEDMRRSHFSSAGVFWSFLCQSLGVDLWFKFGADQTFQRSELKCDQLTSKLAQKPAIGSFGPGTLMNHLYMNLWMNSWIFDKPW